MSTLADTTEAHRFAPSARRHRRDFQPKSKVGPVGIAVMVAFHLVLGYALYAGLGRKAIELVKKPLDATIIDEVKLPPPPPPPPPPRKITKQVEAPRVDTPPPPAYVPPPEVAPPGNTSPIAAVQSTEPVAPPPAVAPAPPAAVAAVAKPASEDIGVACPKQVRPEPPQKALDAGIAGVVKAEVHIRAGKVVDVKMLSGPKQYYAAVRTAVMQYECVSGDDVIARQEFEFKIE